MFSHAAASVAEQAPHVLDDKVSVSLALYLPCRNQPGVDKTLGKVRQSVPYMLLIPAC